MPRGGKRKGAGAPRGNLNALKHGGYSRQFAEIGALIALEPKVADSLLSVRKRIAGQRQSAAEIASLTLVRLIQRAQDIAAGKHPAGLDGLNLTLPHDISDSINEAAAKALRNQTRKAVKTLRKNAPQNRDNQSQSTPERINQPPHTTTH